MLKKIKHWKDICKVHWKEIVSLAFAFHFIFDWFILGLGVVIGMHIGHDH